MAKQKLNWNPNFDLEQSLKSTINYFSKNFDESISNWCSWIHRISFIKTSYIPKFQVVGLDNINDYYDINLKDRLIDLGLDKKNFEQYNVLINKTKFLVISLIWKIKFLQHLFEKENLILYAI